MSDGGPSSRHVCPRRYVYLGPSAADTMPRLFLLKPLMLKRVEHHIVRRSSVFEQTGLTRDNFRRLL
jgi:hypothetical protein